MEKQELVVMSPPTKEELVASLSTAQVHKGYLEKLSPEKLGRIKNSVSNMRHGLHTVAPIMCMGPHKCLYVEHCPIPPKTAYGGPVMKNGRQVFGPDEDYPIARPCVMESFYMQQKIVDYIQSLDVDPANPVEMSIVNELALLDLMKNRCLIILSKGDSAGQGQDFMKVDVTQTDDEGNPTAYSTSLHPAAEYIDRLEKRREKWLDKLLATRKAQIDAAAKMGGQKTESQVLNELQAVREALEGMQRHVIEADEVLQIPLDD